MHKLAFLCICIPFAGLQFIVLCYLRTISKEFIARASGVVGFRVTFRLGLRLRIGLGLGLGLRVGVGLGLGLGLGVG